MGFEPMFFAVKGRVPCPGLYDGDAENDDAPAHPPLSTLNKIGPFRGKIDSALQLFTRHTGTFFEPSATRDYPIRHRALEPLALQVSRRSHSPLAFVFILLSQPDRNKKSVSRPPSRSAALCLLFPISLPTLHLPEILHTEVYRLRRLRAGAIWLAFLGTARLYVSGFHRHCAVPSATAGLTSSTFATVFGFIPRILAAILSLLGRRIRNLLH